jgi:hypothetical protein
MAPTKTVTNANNDGTDTRIIKPDTADAHMTA